MSSKVISCLWKTLAQARRLSVCHSSSYMLLGCWGDLLIKDVPSMMFSDVVACGHWVASGIARGTKTCARAGLALG